MTETGARDSGRPLVSVVIPSHGRHRELQRAIASVQQQTVDDLEILVVDDGSDPPLTPQLVQVLDRRLHIIRRPIRGGGGAARNSGLDRAQGHFIAFLDSDDEWLPRKLEIAIDHLRADGAQVGLSAFTVLRDGRRTLGLPGVIDRDPLEALLTFRGGPMTASCVTIGAQVVQAGLRFDPRLPALQDHDFVTRCAAQFRVSGCRNSLVIKHTSTSLDHTFTIENQRRALHILLESHGELMDRVPGSQAWMREAIALAEMRTGCQARALEQLRRARRDHPSLRNAALLLAAQLGKRPYLAVAKLQRAYGGITRGLLGQRVRERIPFVG